MLGPITCVRWSPSGDMIATASYDRTIALVDIKTEKKIYTETTKDKSKHCAASYIKLSLFFPRYCLLCLLSLNGKLFSNKKKSRERERDTKTQSN